MAEAHLEALERLLGAQLPAGIAALSGPDRQELHDVVVAARRRQARELEASFHATLKQIPFPLRGVVKKVLLG